MTTATILQVEAAPTPRKRQRFEDDEDNLQHFRELYAQGVRPLAMAKAIGVSFATVYLTHRRLGLAPHKPKEVPKPEAKADQSKTVTIQIEKRMREMANIRGCSIALYLRQLAEADFAAARSNSFKGTSVLKPIEEKSPLPFKPISPPRPRRQSDAIRNQRILYLLSEGTEMSVIAQRLGVGKSTIARVRDAHENSELSQRPLRSQVPQRATLHRKWDELVSTAAEKTKEASA